MIKETCNKEISPAFLLSSSYSSLKLVIVEEMARPAAHGRNSKHQIKSGTGPAVDKGSYCNPCTDSLESGNYAGC